MRSPIVPGRTGAQVDPRTSRLAAQEPRDQGEVIFVTSYNPSSSTVIDDIVKLWSDLTPTNGYTGGHLTELTVVFK